MTNSDWAILIENALEGIPAEARDDYRGAAWLRLQQVRERSHEEQERAVTNHIRYQHRRDRQRVTDDIPATTPDPSATDPATLAELRDEVAHELAKLSPLDRAIVSMVAASFNHRDIGAKLNLSPSTICERLRRIRDSRAAAGGRP